MECFPRRDPDASVPDAGGDTRMQQDSSEEWAKAQAELKKKYPEKYKEIEKLQATNLFAAMEKMRELASEASVRFPVPAVETGAGVWAVCPAA